MSFRASGCALSFPDKLCKAEKHLHADLSPAQAVSDSAETADAMEDWMLFAYLTVRLAILATATLAFNVYRNMYGLFELPPFHMRRRTFQYL